MQLISLIVEKDLSVVRQIDFIEGINIITNSHAEGNQIGKSTALRAINFCMGSDGADLWKDPDSKIENKIIKELVTKGNLTFTLELNVRGKPFTIKRRIEEKEQKNRVVLKRYGWINGEEINGQKLFRVELAKIFGHFVDKPSFSTLKKRVFRLEKSSANHLYNYLNFGTSDSEYLEVYSYLFGFAGHNDLSEIIRLEKECEDQKDRISVLLSGKTEQQFRDMLESIDDEIEILNAKGDQFEFKAPQNEAVEKLRRKRVSIANKSSEIGNLETRLLYAHKTLNNYHSKKSDIDVSAVEAIYNEAKTMLPGLGKSLEETINFHNAILDKKSQFVQRQVGLMQEDLVTEKKLLNKFLDDEKILIKAISNETHLGGFVIIEQDLQEKREARGRIAFVLDEIEKSNSVIRDKKRKIDELRENNKKHLDQLKSNLEIFNKESKVLTRAIFKNFGLSFNVGCDSEDGTLSFSVVNYEKISGDGSPRAAALAFDMAFVQYIKESGSKLPEFTVQDFLEAADEDKLAKLSMLANNKNIQVVISILSDKLNSLDDEFKNKNIVLELSPSNKFFKV